MDSRSIVYTGTDPGLADTVGRRLRTHLNREVEWVGSTEDALARLDEGRADCLVLDCMPDTDSLSLLYDARIRRSDVPVVLFTDMGDPETTAEAEEAGVDAFVRKGPGGVDALIETLAGVLDEPRDS